MLLSLDSWNKSTPIEVVTLIQEMFTNQYFKSILLAGSTEDFLKIKVALSKLYNVIQIENPFLKNLYSFSVEKNLEIQKSFFHLFDSGNHSLLDVKLLAQNISSSKEETWFDPLELLSSQQTIFVFKDIDRFDYSTQINLSNQNRVNSSKNVILMLVDKNWHINHFHVELMNNAIKIVVDDNQFSNLY